MKADLHSNKTCPACVALRARGAAGCPVYLRDALTVGAVRRLLVRARKLRLPRVDTRVSNGRARAIISQVLRGRPSTGPVSPLVATLARELAGVA